MRSASLTFTHCFLDPYILAGSHALSFPGEHHPIMHVGDL